jgi:hypothetical protein
MDKRYFSSPRVQSGSGAHTASCQIDTEGSIHEGKALGCEADHSPPSSAGAKSGGAICTFTQMPLLHGAQEQLYHFYFNNVRRNYLVLQISQEIIMRYTFLVRKAVQGRP